MERRARSDNNGRNQKRYAQTESKSLPTTKQYTKPEPVSHLNNTDSQGTRKVLPQNISNESNNKGGDNNERGPNRQNSNPARLNSIKKVPKDPANLVKAKTMPQMCAKVVLNVERVDIRNECRCNTLNSIN